MGISENWFKVKSWYDDEPDVLEFMNDNKDIILDFSKFEKVSIKKSVEILFPQSQGK
jgi:hypothetical protein